MAEIRIEKKRGLSPLMWILILIVLIVAIWFALQVANRPSAPTVEPGTATAAATTTT